MSKEEREWFTCYETKDMHVFSGHWEEKQIRLYKKNWLIARWNVRGDQTPKWRWECFKTGDRIQCISTTSIRWMIRGRVLRTFGMIVCGSKSSWCIAQIDIPCELYSIWGAVWPKHLVVKEHTCKPAYNERALYMKPLNPSLLECLQKGEAGQARKGCRNKRFGAQNARISDLGG